MEESFVIQSSESKVLQGKIDTINKNFDVSVELQGDPNAGSDGIQWVCIKGRKANNVTDAKIHILALCSPELKEHILFPGFPIIIFPAFQEIVQHKIQRECGVVISVTNDGSLDIHGSNIGVTMAISKIHHLHKLNRDRDPNKEKEAALSFDLYVDVTDDEYQEELQTLSNCLKKELYNLLDLPPSTPTVPKVPKDDTASYIAPKQRVESVTVIEDDTEGSIIVIDSSNDDEEEEETDDDELEEGTLKSRLEGDGSGGSLSHLLPPNFVIKEWIKVHYEGTANPSDYVKKSDMLTHFRDHFDLPDHPELANSFFDKLAVRIFPQDPNYRCVKTKRTKNKQSRRRLVCLRRRTVSESEKDDTSPAGASSPRAAPAASPPRPVLPKPLQPTQIPQTSRSSVMKDWNSNRVGGKEIPIAKIKSVELPGPGPAPPVQQQQLVQPIRPAYLLPFPPHSSADLQGWLSTAPKRTQPRMEPKRQDSTFNSLAKRVSVMSNDVLLRRERPCPNPNLRPIVIDGSNVAMAHGNGSRFSCRGIALCVRYFMERGHENITCFVPNFRKGGGGNPPSNDAHLLIKMENMGIIKSTPSRRIGGQNIVCYDDRFIVELAEATNGVILSNDQYRDLMAENVRFRPVVEQQLLQFTIVGDLLMLPEDPLGRKGPSLENFLKLPQNGRKIPPKVIKVPAPLRPRQTPPTRSPPSHPALMQQVPFPTMQHAPVSSAWPARNHNSQSVILSPDQNILAYEMLKIFPERHQDICKVISEHPLIVDIERLMNILLISDTGT